MDEIFYQKYLVDTRHEYEIHFPSVIFKGPLHTINIWGKPTIGKGTQVGAFVEIGDDVVIGENCVIGAYTFIPPKVRIGNRVWIGPRVTFTNDRYPPGETTETWIQDHVVIGAGAIVLTGIMLSADSRIGAGAVVTRSTHSNHEARCHERDWWIGNPAKPVWLR